MRAGRLICGWVGRFLYALILDRNFCILEKSRIEAESKPKQKSEVVSFETKPSRYIPRYTTPSAAGYSVPLDGDNFEMILVDEDKNLILVSANPRLKNTNIFIEANSEMSVRRYGKVLLDCKIDLPSYISELNTALGNISGNQTYLPE